MTGRGAWPDCASPWIRQCLGERCKLLKCCESEASAAKSCDAFVFSIGLSCYGKSLIFITRVASLGALKSSAARLIEPPEPPVATPLFANKLEQAAQLLLHKYQQ